VNIDVSFTALREKPSIGRIELTEREAGERKRNFDLAENGMTQRKFRRSADAACAATISVSAPWGRIIPHGKIDD
jgi:hypothetical protein